MKGRNSSIPANGVTAKRTVTKGRVIELAFAIQLMVLVAPARVWALCPNCLGQTRTLTLTLEMIGAFLLLPFVVAYVVVRAILRACQDLPRQG